jgi:hypothetical protein
MFTDIDLNLKLLRGKPIEIKGIKENQNIKIYPITLDQIEDISMEKYNQFLNLICINKESIKNLLSEELKNIDDSTISVFEFVYAHCTKSEEYKSLIFEALEFFLRCKIEICDYGFILGDISKDNVTNIKIINEEIFNEIVKIIKLQNCIVEKDTEEKIKPANERARKMLEQMRKNQEELDKIKNKSSLTMCDLISIFAAYSENMNILNIWDLTFYQFNDQFNRLKIMKEYDANLQILMHCDTSKSKIELKDWLSPSEIFNKQK